MKKILALVFVSLLLLGTFGVVFATALTADNATEGKTQAAASAAAQGNVYLVPGTYKADGKKVVNTISSGAKKLSQSECDALFTENAYLCTLKAGADLPTPTSKRVDSKGNAFTFNGWWTIVDATVTYFDKVPQTAEDMFLYADWRADLSQRRDPVAPGEGDVTGHVHYLEITRKATGAKEKITLVAGFTDQSNAEKLGYSSARELFNESLTLEVGDTIVVYTTGLADSEQEQIAPLLIGSSRTIILESAGDGSNKTADYLSAYVQPSARVTPTLTALKGGTFKIYIKFFANGSQMNVYMQPV